MAGQPMDGADGQTGETPPDLFLYTIAAMERGDFTRPRRPLVTLVLEVSNYIILTIDLERQRVLI